MTQQLWEMTEEYRESADKLREKLESLRDASGTQSESERTAFNRRRMGLYHMLWELEEKIRLLEEYEETEAADHGADWLLRPGSGGVLAQGQIHQQQSQVVHYSCSDSK